MNDYDPELVAAARDVVRYGKQVTISGWDASSAVHAIDRLERALPPPEPTRAELEAWVVEQARRVAGQMFGEVYGPEATTSFRRAVQRLEAHIKEHGDESP